MPLFRYEALDRNGKTIVGAMQAASEQEVFGRLTSMGYNPVLAQSAPMDARPSAPVATSGPHGAAPYPTVDYNQGYPPFVPAPATGNVIHTSATDVPAASRSLPSWTDQSTARSVGVPSRLSASKRSIARMFHQLHIAFRAGMPAFQAISTVTSQVPEGTLRQALYEISLGVRDGSRISDLLERYPRLFSRGDVGMIRAAEMGGFLPEAFGNLAAQHEQDDNAQRRLRIWVWFFHANVLGLFLLVPFGFFLVPWMASGNDWGVGLRAVGRVFLLFSLPATLLYCGFLAWFQQVRNNPFRVAWWHRILLRLPAVGRINDLRAKAVFTRVLQQLVHVGLPLPMAWETAAFAVPNFHLAQRFLVGKPIVDATARLSAAMQQTQVLEPVDIGMVATGEATGEIAQSLAYLADRYEEENRVALGSGVVRGAVTFTLWSFLLGAIGFAAMSWSLYGSGGGIFKAVEKWAGVGE